MHPVGTVQIFLYPLLTPSDLVFLGHLHLIYLIPFPFASVIVQCLIQSASSKQRSCEYYEFHSMLYFWHYCRSRYIWLLTFADMSSELRFRQKSRHFWSTSYSDCIDSKCKCDCCMFLFLIICKICIINKQWLSYIWSCFAHNKIAVCCVHYRMYNFMCWHSNWEWQYSRIKIKKDMDKSNNGKNRVLSVYHRAHKQK